MMLQPGRYSLIVKLVQKMVLDSHCRDALHLDGRRPGDASRFQPGQDAPRELHLSEGT